MWRGWRTVEEWGLTTLAAVLLFTVDAQEVVLTLTRALCSLTGCR